MLYYYFLQLYDILLVKSTEVIPTLTLDLPDYHAAWVAFCDPISCFIDVTDFAKLTTIFVTYQLIRIACALRRTGKQL